MRHRLSLALALACIGAAAGARADVVADVHDLALRTARAARASPDDQAFTLTIVDLAMFEAANAVEGRYRPYRTSGRWDAPGSTDAATASVGAGCTAIARQHPTQGAAIAAACDALKATLPGPGRAEGLAFGNQVGAALCDERRAAEPRQVNAYRPKTSPGVYVATPLPIGTGLGELTPFALRAAAQMRPPPPYASEGEAWARDFNESKSVGSRTSAERSPPQTATALFFASGGAQQFLDSIPGLASGPWTALSDHARFLALMTMALSDTIVAVFDAKNAYDFWRPITAIRNGDIDGNDATERDPGWVPLLDTPLHQEYPCAHCAVAAAVVGVFAAVRGSAGAMPALTIVPATAAGAVPAREWTRAADFLADVANARVWGGMHFRSSTTAGVGLGSAVAQWVVANELAPVSPR